MKNLELYFKHKACNVYYNKEIHAVQTYWKGELLLENEFRIIMTKVYELLKEKKTDTIIGNTSKMKMLSALDQEWLIKELRPQTIAAGLKVYAVIVERDTFNEFSIKKIKQISDDHQVLTQEFYTLDEAIEWVKSLNRKKHPIRL